jgi:hypothetical protein
MQFSEEKTQLVGSLFCIFLIISLILGIPIFSDFQNVKTFKMNLWANAQKNIINAGENTMLNFHYKF